jgi:hypothetical protein
MVMAEVHERITHPISWRSLASDVLDGGLILTLGSRALGMLGFVSPETLRRAHEEREALKRELAEIVKDPARFLGELPGKLREEYAEKWRRFLSASGTRTLEAQYEAGKILGGLTGEVLLALAGAATGAGAVARIASKAPRLAKIVGLGKRAPAGRPMPSPSVPPGPKATPAIPPQPRRSPTETLVGPGPGHGPSAQKAIPDSKATPNRRPKAPPTKKGPPVLRSVTPEERALAAIPGDSPAQRTARRRVTESFLEEYGREWDPKQRHFVKMDEVEIRNQLAGIDLTKPVSACPPPEFSPDTRLYQWQAPGRHSGQYFAEASSVPDKLGISAQAADARGVLVKKIRTAYQVEPQAPYLKSTAAPANDSWSIPGQTIETSGGDAQYIIGERDFARAVN